MSNYTKTTNFAVKDSLATGNPSKKVKGTEIDAEFVAIAAAISSKVDANDSTLTGTTSVVNISASGTYTGTINGGTY
jgi:hypothetical protein